MKCSCVLAVVGLLLLVRPGTAVSRAPEPKITITPTSGTIDMQVTVQGEGFPAGEIVGIYLGIPNAGFTGPTYSTVMANSTGRFNTAFVMPGEWPNHDPILEKTLTVIAATQGGAVKASAEFAFTPASLEALDWKPYKNDRFGFSLMLPPDWEATEFGDIIDLRLTTNPDAGKIKIILSPSETIEGGKIDGQSVLTTSLEDYARVALGYELGGPGSLTLQKIQPFRTEQKQGYLASWTEQLTGLSTSVATTVGAPNVILEAAYLDLNKLVDGKFYRVLEISMTLAPLPTMGTFNAIIHSLTIDQAVSAEDSVAIQAAVKGFFQQAGSPTGAFAIEAQRIDGDYVRFNIVQDTNAGNNMGFGFARKQEDTWTIIAIGTDFGPDFYKSKGIPDSLSKSDS